MRYYSSIAVDNSVGAPIASATPNDVSTITLTDIPVGFPTSYPFTLAIGFDTDNEELVDVTAASGATLTVTRGRDGTSAPEHAVGEPVKHVITGRDMREAQTHMANETDAHGISIANIAYTSGTGNVSSTMLASGAVTTAKIADLNVTTGKLADASVTTAKIADDAITTGKIAAGAVGTADIADSAVTSAKIADGTIVDADINASAAIAKTKISGTAITAADTGTVTSTMIADGTIVNADISASAAIAQSKVSGLTSDLAGKLSTSGKAADSSLIDGRTVFVQAATPTANATGDIWFQVAGL